MLLCCECVVQQEKQEVVAPVTGLLALGRNKARLSPYWLVPTKSNRTRTFNRSQLKPENERNCNTLQ
jgi:hypothetical protein